jgi:hypothetical protein
MIKKQFFALLLFIYIFASYLGATHIHHDSEQNYHDDCQVCLLNNNLHSGVIPLQESDISLLSTHFSEPLFRHLSYTFTATLSYQAQAPPSFFFT